MEKGTHRSEYFFRHIVQIALPYPFLPWAEMGKFGEELLNLDHLWQVTLMSLGGEHDAIGLVVDADGIVTKEVHS